MNRKRTYMTFSILNNMKPKCGIYKITNRLNGKIYIGQAIDIQKRWRAHLSCAKNQRYEFIHLYRAFNKYGSENFTFEIIKECLEEDLNCLESFFIRAYYSWLPEIGYNMNLGGGVKHGVNNPMHGKQHSDEAKQRIGKINSEKNTGKKWWTNGEFDAFTFECPDGYQAGRTNMGDEESFARRSEAMKGKKIGCKWWTNGFDYKFQMEQPDGYELGGFAKPGTSEKLTGRKWFTNGLIQVHEFECPDGFWPGTCQRTVKGMKWWTDGSISRRSHECPGPTFYLGKPEHQKNNGKKNIGKHWYTDGKTNVRDFHCPSGFRPGKIHKR